MSATPSTSTVRIYVALSLLIAPMLAWGFGSWRIVASEGDDVPGQNGRIGLLDLNYQTSIHESGTITTLAEFYPNGGGAQRPLFSLSGPLRNDLRMIASTDQLTPALDARISGFRRKFSSSDGAVWFDASLSDVTNFGNRALYRVNSTGGIQEMLRKGKPFASGLKVCDDYGYDSAQLAFQDNGSVFTTATIDDGNGCRSSLLHISPSGTVTTSVREGAAVSGTSATLQNLSYTTTYNVLTDGNGTIFFHGRDTDSFFSQRYSYRNSAVHRVVQAREDGDFASAGDTFTRVNEATDRIERFVGPSFGLMVIAENGQEVPNRNGRFGDFSMDVSPTGEIVFTSFLTGTPGGSSDNAAIYLVDSAGVVEIARESGPALPPGTTFYQGFSPFSIGPQGQVVFEAIYQSSGGSRRALLYFSRSHGLQEILSTTTRIGNETVVGWSYAGGASGRMTSAGELAVRIRTNLSRHIALFSLADVDVHRVFKHGFERQ